MLGVEGLAHGRCAGMEALGEGVCKLLHHPCTCVLEEGATPIMLLLFVLLASSGSGPSTEGKGAPPRQQLVLATMRSHPHAALGPTGTPLLRSELRESEGTRGCVCPVLKCPEFR